MELRQDSEQYTDDEKKGIACSIVSNDEKGDEYSIANDEKKGDICPIVNNEKNGDECPTFNTNLKNGEYFPSNDDEGPVPRVDYNDMKMKLSFQIQELELENGKMGNTIQDNKNKIKQLEKQLADSSKKMKILKKEVDIACSEKTKKLEEELREAKKQYDMLYKEYNAQLSMKEIDEKQTHPAPDIFETETLPMTASGIHRKTKHFLHMVGEQDTFEGAFSNLENSDGCTSETFQKSSNSISQTTEDTGETSNYELRYYENFEELELLGQGSFGTVCKVKHKHDENYFAVKKIRLFSTIDRTFQREVREWSRLDPNKGIVGYVTSWIELPCANLQQIEQCSGQDSDSSDDVVFQDSESQTPDEWNESVSTDSMAGATCGVFYIQMELCNRETLEEIMDDLYDDPEKILTIFIQIVSALEHIHERNLIHRDLKPSNILFSLDAAVVKIGDFGLVKCTRQNGSSSDGTKHSAGVGNEFYRAPEQAGEDYNEMVDIYSMGKILYKMLHNFSTYSEFADRLREDIFEKSPDKCLCDNNEIKLVRSMLKKDPNMRPSASNILTGDLLRGWKERIETEK